MILKIRKEPKGLYFESGNSRGWLKDALSLPDLVHNLKPVKVVILDPLKDSGETARAGKLKGSQRGKLKPCDQNKA